MQFDLVANTQALCRVCMTNKEGHRTDLYDAGQPSLHGMLKAVCASVFERSDAEFPPGKPTKVCAICRNAILAAYELHQTCVETDRRLGELLALKWELHDQEDDERTRDPLGVADEGGHAEEQPTASDVKTERDMEVFEEKQSKEQMEDSLTDGKLEDTIKVEEQDLMDEGDNEDGTKVDSNDCMFCGKKFNGTVSLLRHKTAVHSNVTDLNRPFTCNLCKAPFATNLERKEHKQTHLNSAICSCGRKFKSERRFKKHIDSGKCSGELGKRCTVCDKTFNSVDSMVLHRNTVHMGSVVCPECGKTVANFSCLRVHLEYGHCSVMKNLPPTKAVLANRTCKICGEVQKTHYAVRAHIKRAHPECMHPCDMCSMEFQSEKNLILHKKKHDTKTFSCKTCSENLPTKRALMQHRRTHNVPVKCTICDKMFSSKHSLTSHMERHVGIKAFACDICPMRFISKVEINGHMLTHTKIQDHVCDLCGSRFTKKNSLKKHILQVHEGQRPFPCSLCSLKFSDASRLQRHMYTHTGEKPHKCELCPQAYAQTNDLVKHVARAHGDGNPYLCDRCDEGFRLMTDLRQHYRVHVQSTEGGAEQMEEVRFTSVAILKRAFAKAKQRLSKESDSS